MRVSSLAAAAAPATPQQRRQQQRRRAAASAALPASRAAGGGDGEPDAAPGTPAAAAGAVVTPGPSMLPGPSRLQLEEGRLIAIDVEYTHLQMLPGPGRRMGLPTEVCALDASGQTLLHEHCNPLDSDLLTARWRHVGGQRPALWHGAAPLEDVRRRLAALLEGRILVGHHLSKDLAALGLSHPAEATRDTLRYRELQGRRAAGRKLRDLSAEKLGRPIQAAGRRHCPREDAQAAMDLYLRQVHYAKRHMSYDDLVEAELASILSVSSSGSGSSSSGSVDAEDGVDGSDGEEDGGSGGGGGGGGDCGGGGSRWFSGSS